VSYTPSDEELVWDIVHAARRIGRYSQDLSRERFFDDDLRQSAIIRQIGIIGEASRRLSAEFRAAHKEIPWTSIIGMRNEVIHAYQRVNLDDVWRVVISDGPALIRNLEPLLTLPDSTAEP
jgi:uncharacterized protein with HEPN domain